MRSEFNDATIEEAYLENIEIGYDIHCPRSIRLLASELFINILQNHSKRLKLEELFCMENLFKSHNKNKANIAKDIYSIYIDKYAINVESIILYNICDLIFSTVKNYYADNIKNPSKDQINNFINIIINTKTSVISPNRLKEINFTAACKANPTIPHRYLS